MEYFFKEVASDIEYLQLKCGGGEGGARKERREKENKSAVESEEAAFKELSFISPSWAGVKVCAGAASITSN
jgi:hypothetical protein